MTNLGELTKLLEQGFLTGEYIHTSQDGVYRFEIKTITPLEEVQAEKAARGYDASSSESDQRVYSAIEILARCITKVNGVDLESVPGAEGTTALEKRRSILKRLSSPLVLGLWEKYQAVRNTTQLEGDKEESEAIKK